MILDDLATFGIWMIIGFASGIVYDVLKERKRRKTSSHYSDSSIQK